MSIALPVPLAPSRLDDDAWDDLLNFIEEKRVIPIIGPELLKVDTDTGPRLLYDWLADKLAVKLNVDTQHLPQPYSLNDVVCWQVASHGRREEAYTRLRSILREATFAPPVALKQLAQITDFDLFVTTTFDGYLEQAKVVVTNKSKSVICANCLSATGGAKVASRRIERRRV